MRRWSPSELAAVKAELEAKAPNDWTREDHYLALDYTIQRYLPADEVRTEAEWQRTRAQLQAKVDANIRRKENGEEDPLWLQEAKHQAELRRRANVPYNLSIEEFTTTILPALGRFPFAPDVSELTADDIQNLWLASCRITETSTWDDKYKTQDAQSAMRIRYHQVILDACLNLRRNFETLCQANAAGYGVVKVVVREGCECYGHLDDTCLEVPEALAAFHGENTTCPLLPPPDSACSHSESPWLCDIRLILMDSPKAGNITDLNGR